MDRKAKGKLRDRKRHRTGNGNRSDHDPLEKNSQSASMEYVKDRVLNRAYKLPVVSVSLIFSRSVQ